MIPPTNRSLPVCIINADLVCYVSHTLKQSICVCVCVRALACVRKLQSSPLCPTTTIITITITTTTTTINLGIDFPSIYVTMAAPPMIVRLHDDGVWLFSNTQHTV